MAESFSVRRQRGFTTIALFCFFALYLPIAVLVIFAFNDGASLSDWKGFSLRWFQKAAENQLVIDTSIRSLQIAGIAAVIATAAATLPKADAEKVGSDVTASLGADAGAAFAGAYAGTTAPYNPQ